MRERFEFRIPEQLAARHLPDGVGTRLSITRRVVLLPDDPLFSRIGAIEQQMRAQEGRPFFTAWLVRRSYSRKELQTAMAIRAIFSKTFEPAGEECGTQYDESSACERCGAGAIQEGSLFLNGSMIPSRSDFSRTIAGELIVSRRVVDLFHAHRFDGAQFDPVRLTDRRGAPSDHWFQLQSTSPSVRIHPRTRTGRDPFDLGGDSSNVCPNGDLLGLNLLSELHLEEETLDRRDLQRTAQYLGVRRGLLRPEPELTLSPRLLAAFEDAQLKGLRVEVAHLVRSE